ncbi:hypothetical protein CBL_12105 [Carabus blaptoides fortunei]
MSYQSDVNLEAFFNVCENIIDEGLNPTVYSETENVEAFFQVCEDLIHAELQPRIDQILLMEIDNVRFIDSLNFLPMSLASLVKALDLPPSLKKGYFPHLFNTVENSSYVGPLPDVEFYGANNMHSDHREQFLKWHAGNVRENYIFNMSAEIVEYCVSDVDILRQPSGGYRMRDTQSRVALEWLIWEEETRQIRIEHAARGREAVLDGGLKVDGYYAPTKLVFEFHGCFYHGHNLCFRTKRNDPILNNPHESLNSRFDRTVAKTKKLRELGDELNSSESKPVERDGMDDNFNAFINHCERIIQDELDALPTVTGASQLGCGLTEKELESLLADESDPYQTDEDETFEPRLTEKELESLLVDESDPYQTDEDETFEPSFSDIRLTEKELESLLADESDPYQTDEDETFEPSFSDISSNDYYVNNDVLVNEGEQSTEHITPKRARKRKINQDKCKKCVAKLQCTPIKTIMHKFLEPGHTYIECDRDFGLIEKKKKKIPQVFIPKHWTTIIQKSSRNFEVKRKTLPRTNTNSMGKMGKSDSIVAFIPPVHHSYYEKLPHTKGKNAKANKKSTKTSDEPNEDIDIFDDDLVLQSDYDD